MFIKNIIWSIIYISYLRIYQVCDSVIFEVPLQNIYDNTILKYLHHTQKTHKYTCGHAVPSHHFGQVLPAIISLQFCLSGENSYKLNNMMYRNYLFIWLVCLRLTDGFYLTDSVFLFEYFEYFEYFLCTAFCFSLFVLIYRTLVCAPG